VSTAPGMTVIQQWQIHRPVSPGRRADRAYQVCRQIGITSLQSYVVWSQIEPEPGRVTYDTYDPVVACLRRNHLKWLPFIITGPYYATPKWFRDRKGVSAVCLEHGREVPIQSIWNPHLRDGVKRFLKLFRAHYEADVIEALNLGISGNWGESLMPAGGGFEVRKLPGYHCHRGWWCGDRYARADWRRWLREKYQYVGKLNRAWGTSFVDFDAVDPFVPSEAPSPRAAVDLVTWSTQSMTDLAEFWVRTARELYPDLPIYLCTGGSGDPALGADFAAQARMCAKYKAGIRITNQSDDALRNFAHTRMVSSATRLYGQYYTTEPGGANSPRGIAGRIFDIVSGGGRGVYFKTLVQGDDRPSPQAVAFARNAQYLVPNSPKLSVAALMPNASIAIDARVLNLFLERSAQLRDALDFEFIDENMIADGLLDRFKAVVWLAGSRLEARSAEALRKWIRSGGVLLVSTEHLPLKTVENAPVGWIAQSQTAQPPVNILFPNGRPARVRVDIGGADEVALSGQWHAPEGVKSSPTQERPDPTFRWTGGDARVKLPIPRGASPVIRVHVSMPQQVGSKGSVTVNGVEVIHLVPGESKWLEAAVPDKVIGDSDMAVVAFHTPTWEPDQLGLGKDGRGLGVQVYAVELVAHGSPPRAVVPLERLRLRIEVDLTKAVETCVQRLGKGYVVVWPGAWDSYLQFLNAILHADTEQVPFGQLSEPIDAAFDNVLACRVGDAIYYYNNHEATLHKVSKIQP